jgi:hypothetical protein
LINAVTIGSGWHNYFPNIVPKSRQDFKPDYIGLKVIAVIVFPQTGCERITGPVL